MEKSYEINIHIKNSVPIQLEDIALFFKGINQEYNLNLGKAYELNMPDIETKLAISAVKPGSQIFTIVAVVSADCLFPYLNQEILVSFFKYIKTLLNDFAELEKLDKEKYSKKTCQNVVDISNLYEKDFDLDIEFEINENNTIIDYSYISNKQGNKIHNKATELIMLHDEITNNQFEDKLLFFYQTQNSNRSAGDKVIIGDFSDKAKKIEFISPSLKESIINNKENFFRYLYRASGYVNYQEGKIKSYTITKIERTSEKVVNE